MTTVKNIYDYINKIAPFDTQEEWDNSGFLIGDFSKEVKKAVLSLDVTKGVSAFAASQKADLIISHHPVIFDPIKEIKKESAAYTCVSNDISVISAHTNFDKAACGINANLCKRLGLINAGPVENSFIYSGQLECEMSINDFARFVKSKLSVNGLRYTNSSKPVRIVAVGGGACEEYVEFAKKTADCFLTGDMKYHQMLECAEDGFSVISAGHFETEAESFRMLSQELKNIFTDVEFIWGNQKNPVLAV